MTYHIARNNQQLGAFSKEDLLARYNRAEILPTDLVWTEGMPTWQPASQIFGAPVAPAGSDFAAPTTPFPYPAPPPVPTTPLIGAATPAATGVPTSSTMNPNSGTQRPANSLVLAIVATVLSVLSCNIISLVIGIISIIMAAQVDGKFNAGDAAGARGFALAAKILGWVAIAFLILMLPFVVIGFTKGFAGAMQHGGY